MIKLYINNENINNIYNYNYLSINDLTIDETNNINFIYKFINLQKLFIYNNKIT